VKLENLEKFIERSRDLKVLVIGETIIDRFISVTYEGPSMKSFCPVFKVVNESFPDQEGGSLAIANHLKNFVDKVDLVTNPKAEIVKTRLVDANGMAKHVEINRINVTPCKELDVDYSQYNVVIVADFGHGFCTEFPGLSNFHLMCQTNSNNFGFNRLSKWKKYKKKSICVDLREAGLQLNKKVAKWDEKNISQLFNYELSTEELFVTQGKEGASLYNGNKMTEVSNYSTDIVDTIGAGDTFFSFATLASALQVPDNEKLIIPSLAASLSTTWLCNEKSVSPQELLNHASRFL